jgi:hypothetical protein
MLANDTATAARYLAPVAEAMRGTLPSIARQFAKERDRLVGRPSASSVGITYELKGRIYERGSPPGFANTTYEWRIKLKRDNGRWGVVGFDTVYASIVPIQSASRH